MLSFETLYLVVHAGVGGSLDRQETDIFTFDGKLVYKEILKSYSLLKTGFDYANGNGYAILGNNKYEKNYFPTKQPLINLVLSD